MASELALKVQPTTVETNKPVIVTISYSSDAPETVAVPLEVKDSSGEKVFSQSLNIGPGGVFEFEFRSSKADTFTITAGDKKASFAVIATQSSLLPILIGAATLAAVVFTILKFMGDESVSTVPAPFQPKQQ